MTFSTLQQHYLQLNVDSLVSEKLSWVTQTTFYFLYTCHDFLKNYYWAAGCGKMETSYMNQSGSPHLTQEVWLAMSYFRQSIGEK